jgi:hypothetical protein
MLRSLSGYQAQYHYLTLLVVSEFNEWRILIIGPGVSIHGQRQFSEAKAKEHAVALAKHYLHDRKKENLPELPEVAWEPASEESWLVYRG